MASLKELKKYLGHEFESACYRTEDYTRFENKLINYVKSICKKNNWIVINVNRGHFCCSLFIRDERLNYVNVIFNDVRFYQDEWYNSVLHRQAESSQDYRGGINNYCSLDELEDAIKTDFYYFF